MEVFGCFCYIMLLWSLFGAFQLLSSCWRKKLPPGPRALPVIGNLLALGVGDTIHRTLMDFSRIHGPVMSLKFGWVVTVVISSAAAAKEVLQKHDLSFADRAVPDAARNLDHHLFSIALLPVGPRWRNLRRICKSHIFLAERLVNTEVLRRQKVDELLQHVWECASAGIPIDIGQVAFSTALNLLSNTIFSIDLADLNSKTARQFKSLVNDIMSAVGEPNLSDFFPVLRHLDIQGIRRRLAGHTARMNKMLSGFIAERVLARKASDYQPHKDVLDALLDICDEDKHGLDCTGMRHFLMDLFSAGTDTTSITVEWCMAELIHNPAIFSKLREEMDRFIGKGNLVQESDLDNLPYLQDVVKETFRMHPSTPFLLPRKAKEDTVVMGFTVPKGAQVLVNAFAIGRDPESWENPNSFSPERFLGSEMDVKGHNLELIPFGAGRRICPGYPLAMRMVPLMVASLVQSFDWEPADGVAPKNMDMEDSFGHALRKAKPLRAIPVAV